MKACKLKIGYMVVILLGMMMSPSVFAQFVAEQVSEVTIISMSTYSNYAAVKFEPALTATSSVNCGSNDRNHAVIDWSSDSDNKNMYNALLAAFLLNKTVGFGIANINGITCHTFASGVAKIYRVDYVTTTQ